MIALVLVLGRGPDVLFWGREKGSEEAPCLCRGSRMNRMLINYPPKKPEVWKPSLALSCSHVRSFPPTSLTSRPLFPSPLPARLLLSHRRGAMRCADVPANKAPSSAMAPMEQPGEPRRQRWVKAANCDGGSWFFLELSNDSSGNQRIVGWVLFQDRARG